MIPFKKKIEEDLFKMPLYFGKWLGFESRAMRRRDTETASPTQSEEKRQQQRCSLSLLFHW